MERELKLLAESVFEIWNNALKISGKDASLAVMGDMSAHVIGALTGFDDWLYLPDMSGKAFEDAQKVRRFENDVSGLEHERIAALNTIETAEKYAENLSGLGYLEGHFSVEPSETKQIFEAAKGVSLNRLGQADIMHRMAAAVKPALFNDTTVFLRESADGMKAFENELRREQTSVLYSYEQNIGVPMISDEEHGISDAQKVVFNNTYEMHDQVERHQARYRENSAFDIKLIGDALARELHEQIAAGFPMYMR